jgi:GntR family transcriptional regulator / MocR family aminotransferase
MKRRALLTLGVGAAASMLAGLSPAVADLEPDGQWLVYRRYSLLIVGQRDSRPLPALKSLDRDGRVLYAGTFSKVLLPSIRLAYLVVPETQVERFEQISEAFAGGSPELTQAIVAAFIKEGHFARHIQRMRMLYAERREATAAGLESALGKYMRIDSQPGGMHLILRLQGRRSDRRLVARMREEGLYAEALTDWMIGHDGISALLVNFTNIDSQNTAENLGRRILGLI